MKSWFISIVFPFLCRQKNMFVSIFSSQKQWIFIVIAAYCVSDLLILYIRPSLVVINSKVRLMNHQTIPSTALTDYTPIWDFNIFHNESIPARLSSLTVDSTPIVSLEPVKSTLPLKLNGTIVYNNPTFSIANITITSKNQSAIYHEQDKVGSLATIVQITSDRVYLFNQKNNKSEYIEVIALSTFKLDFKNKKKIQYAHKKQKIVKKKINRSLINQALRSAIDVMQQARVVPHWVKGKMVGYRFTYIKPGSVYEKLLDFKVSDVLKSVEGEPLRSEIQGAELFHRLKNKSKLSIVLMRGDKDIPISWDVDEDTAIEDTSDIRFQ